MSYADFYDLLRYLRKEVPLPYPFQVRRVALPSDRDGDCDFRKKKFYIRIHKSHPEYYAIDVLIHEIAHCVAWGKDKDDYHGRYWGMAYAFVYRKFLDWIDNQP